MASAKIYRAEFSDGEIFEICSSRTIKVAWRWLGAGKKIGSRVGGDYGLSVDHTHAEKAMARSTKPYRDKGWEIFSTEIVNVTIQP